jgi:hypothetical protein
MFHIINLRTNKEWPNENLDAPKVFENGKDAEAAAQNLNRAVENVWGFYTIGAINYDAGGRVGHMDAWFGEETGNVNRNDKWQVRRVAKEEKDWRERERARYASGHHLDVPWSKDPDWIEWVKKEPQCDHFVRMSRADEECIAYIKNEEAGVIDHSTRTTPARYFKKFVPEDDAKGQAMMQNWIRIWTKVKNNVDLKITKDREEIRRVYEHGPDSCMKGAPSRFFQGKGAPHPAEVYADDLAVAYIERNKDKKGNVTARAVVWPEKKHYQRVYGNDSALLDTLLKADGYKVGNFDGARLLHVDVSEFTKKANSILMPHVDGSNEWVKYDDDKNELRLFNTKVDRAISIHTTQGWITLPYSYISELSGKKFYSDKDPMVVIHVSAKKTQNWATSEMTAKTAYQCIATGEHYSREHFPPLMVLYGHGGTGYMSPTATNLKKVGQCAFYNMPALTSELGDVVVGYDAKGKPICEKWSITAQSSMAFVEQHRSRNRFVAVWLRSRLPWAFTLSAENEHAAGLSTTLKLKQATYPKEVTRRNAGRLLRRAIFDPAQESGYKVVEADELHSDMYSSGNEIDNGMLSPQAKVTASIMDALLKAASKG